MHRRRGANERLGEVRWERPGGRYVFSQGASMTGVSRAVNLSPSHGMRLLLAATLLACTLAGGCAGGAIDKLPRDAEMAEHGPLVAAAERLAVRTTRVPVGEVQGKTVHLAVHEVGPGNSPRIAVLLHGILSDSRMWRYIRPQLAEMPNLDVMEVDLLGSGDSDCPDPRKMSSDAYGPTALARGVL